MTQDEVREHRHLTHYLNQDPSIHAYYQFNETIQTVYDKIGGRHASFTGGSGRVNSTAPVGGGEVSRQTVNGSGTYNFGSTGIEMTFSSGVVIPIGELAGFHLNVPPDESPGIETLPQQGYYIVNNYGDHATFSELQSITFGPNGIPNVDAQNYANLSLSKRSSNAESATWTNGIDIADTGISSGSTGSVTFSAGNNITSFGQFIIQKENCPDTLVVNVQPIGSDTLRAELVLLSNGQEFAGADVVFHAGNHIDLNEGFTVESGANFLADIAGCSNSISTTFQSDDNNEAASEEILNAVGFT